jgi:ParB family chromosome partitioning protein
MKVMNIPIKHILVREDHRDLNEEKARELAESIGVLGVVSPITVRRNNGFGAPGTFILVAGQHRLEAARLAGNETVPCILMPSRKKARKWRLAENLHRAELSALQRAEDLTEWMKLNEGEASAHPVRKHKIGRPEGLLLKLGKKGPFAGKSTEARRKQMERALKVAAISEPAKLAAKKAGLDDNLTALLNIAKEETPEGQMKRVEALIKPSGKSIDRRQSSATGRNKRLACTL